MIFFQTLGPDTYLYVLDKNCVQFEPDHPTYVETAQYVYDFIDTMGHFEALHSTRHYGPMVFHLIWEKKADNLIVYYLKKLQLEEASKVSRDCWCKKVRTGPKLAHY